VVPAVVQEPLPALALQVPADWRSVLAEELRKPYFVKLQQFLDAQRQASPVLPTEGEVFNAFKLTPYDRVRVVLLGEEPSAVEGEAHGLAYSVSEGQEPSPTLLNFFDELRADLGCWKPNTGDLTPWARQGVLLLNSVLTVRAGAPGSHRGKGWETFTDAVLRAVSAQKSPVVFLLLGAFQKKGKLVDESRHVVVTAPDPDPDADDDFVGSRAFSAVNDALELRGQSAIYWQLFGV
jgi:uracil-DNA glycosylase